MNKEIIIQVTVVSQQGVGITEVGKDGVVEIKEDSMELETGAIDRVYSAYDKEGNILKRIENCPCDITFKKVKDSK